MLKQGLHKQNIFVNVSLLAGELGFKQPVMLSQEVHFRLLPDEAENSAGESYLHRLLEVLSLALEAVGAHPGMDARIPFQVFLHERSVTGHWMVSRVELWCCRQGKGYVIAWPEERGV